MNSKTTSAVRTHITTKFYNFQKILNSKWEQLYFADLQLSMKYFIQSASNIQFIHEKTAWFVLILVSCCQLLRHLFHIHYSYPMFCPFFCLRIKFYLITASCSFFFFWFSLLFSDLPTFSKTFSHFCKQSPSSNPHCA